MMKMEYKLLGFDLDGTILTGEKKLSARTKRALEEAIAPVSYTHLDVYKRQI